MIKPDFDNAYGWNPANRNYKTGNESIGTIYLTGGGYTNEPFTGVGIDSQFGWEEMVWAKNPKRTKGAFNFKNIDSVDVGLVPRCEVNLKYMNYEQYKKLRRIVGRERYFWVRFFNIDTGEWINREMYLTDDSRNKLHILKQSLIGVVDIVLKFAGTNNDVEAIESKDGVSVVLKKYNVTFNLSNGGVSGSGNTPETIVVTYGSQIQLPDDTGIIAPSGYHLAGWVKKDGNTIVGTYGLNQKTTLWKSMDLYALWEKA